jgi:hypothetical protein
VRGKENVEGEIERKGKQCWDKEKKVRKEKMKKRERKRS